ncbi:MAG: DUF5675 family protein, partial [Bacteroides sp.]
TKTTDYVGNMIYENGSLKRILVDGGYIENDKYYYYIQDHLGNNRVVAQADGSVLQVSHYYPFGMTFTEDNTGDSKAQPYKYNGKEFDGERGLNVYDYSARYMDPALGRFMTVDPLAEQFPHQSPYSAFNNNPIFYIDPDGRAAVTPGDFYDREGTYLGTDGNDDGKVYLLNEGKVAKFENKAVNWGGTLAEASVNNLKENSTEVGGLIIQTRTEEGKDYTISEFKTVGGENNVEGYMLEPGGPSTTTPNQDKRIPEGVYDVENYSSAKYSDNFLLSNKDVPKSRKILYHAGNYPSHTKGCNMPGKTKGNGTVGGSKTKFSELRTFIKTEGASNVKTIIVNKIPK